MRLTYMGHATVLLEMDGVTLLTDPLLRSRVAHLHRYAPPARLEDARRADAVLVSHVHHDHLDLPSLRALRPRRLLGPVGLRALAADVGADVVELAPGMRAVVEGLGIRATHADHVARRLPWQRPLPAIGFVVEGRQHVYFAGDTGLFSGMAAIDELLDVALLPISGWGPRIGPAHLNPEQAARALALLRPRVAIPIHWGTYASPRSQPADPVAPAHEFERLAAKMAPDVDVRVLMPGEQTSVAAVGSRGARITADERPR